MEKFDPNEDRGRCEKYLSGAMSGVVRLLHAAQLTKSTRDAPWRLDIEVDGSSRSLVLRIGTRRIEHEYEFLRAMESVPIPTPRAFGWDPRGDGLGAQCFVSEFVDGESLLAPLLEGESWAEEMYISTSCALQAITREQLKSVAHLLGDGESAADILEQSYDYFKTRPDPLADAVYEKMKSTLPKLPNVLFSNGDLYPDNMIVRGRDLAGVIDFETAGFSDPVYEFLLPFFIWPKLRGRGIEERYCERMGFDPANLDWYHALEFFDIWQWAVETGKSFYHHSADSLREDLQQWLDKS